MEAGTLERRVTVVLPVPYKTQRRVGQGPGHGVACVTDCAGGTAGSTRCTVAKSAFNTTARWIGEEPVDVVQAGKSSALDGYTLLIDDDKSAVMALGDREAVTCRQKEKGPFADFIS